MNKDQWLQFEMYCGRDTALHRHYTCELAFPVSGVVGHIATASNDTSTLPETAPESVWVEVYLGAAKNLGGTKRWRVGVSLGLEMSWKEHAWGKGGKTHR